MTFVIPYPIIDPVLFEIGPFAIRWYALAYVAGLLLGWWYARWMCRRPPSPATDVDMDDFLVWATLGVLVGGRLGYVLFYKSGYYLDNPLAALEVWKGGMSFHGGLLGVVVATLLFCRVRKIPTSGVRRHHLLRGAHRPAARPPRQLRQRRTVRPGHRRAVGHGVSRLAVPSRATRASSTRRRWRASAS